MGRNKYNKKKYLNKPTIGHPINNLDSECGFLVTCNENKEKFAVREIYNMLNDYFDQICEQKGIDIENHESQLNKRVPDKIDRDCEKSINGSNENTRSMENNVEIALSENRETENGKNTNDKALQEEDTSIIANVNGKENGNIQKDYKNEEYSKPKNYIFKQMKIKSKGVLFIKMFSYWSNIVSPHEIVNLMLEEIYTEKKVLSKHLNKVWPIEIACDAAMPAFKNFAPNVIKKFFPENELTRDQNFTWDIGFKCRNNSKFNKNQFLDFLNQELPNCYAQKIVNPDKIFMVDITQHIMCLSVIDGNKKIRNYNVNPFAHELQQIKVNEKRERERKNENNEVLKQQNDLGMKLKRKESNIRLLL